MTGGRPQVLYIMGAGRSGSTLLGIAIGNLPTAFFGGELFAWHHFRGVPITDDAALAEFWRDLGAGVPEQHRHFEVDLHRELEHPRSLLRPWRRTARLRQVHADHNRALFERIVAVTGASVVVDSSHYPLRAGLLRRNPGLDVRVVHLVRDPRQVVDALQSTEQRHAPMPPAVANLYCWVVAALSAAALLRFPADRRLVLRYEDFVADPAAAVARIAALQGLSAAPIDPDHLVVGQVFQGNRLRHQATVAVRPQRPTARLGRRWAMATSVLQWPLLLAYGYVGRRARGPR